MWDTVTYIPGDRGPVTREHLSHDLPCLACGHGLHTFLACGDDCSCPPVSMPGSAVA